MQVVNTVTTYTHSVAPLESVVPVYVKEEWVNETKGWVYGDSGIYESFCDTSMIDRLFRFMQKEYGRCISYVYREYGDIADVKSGWVFSKTQRYEDSKDTYVQETWVSLYIKNDDGAYVPLVLK